MAKKTKNKNDKNVPSNGVPQRLKKYVAILEKENLHELDIQDGSFQIRLTRHGTGTMPVPYASPGPVEIFSNPKPINQSNSNSIKSPIAGVFYRAPSPNAAPYVSEGDTITTGQTLCIVEAMKVMNEIAAETSGRIVKILVENGKPVEAGQVLFTLEPMK